MDWNDCLYKKYAKRITPDRHRSDSLIETANQRISVIGKLTRQNCNFVFEDYYTSLLELIQALSFREGYNVLNHVCLGAFLRDVQGRNDMYAIFDDLRYKRNSLTYYGIRMDYETAEYAISRCKKMIQWMIELL